MRVVNLDAPMANKATVGEVSIGQCMVWSDMLVQRLSSLRLPREEENVDAVWVSRLDTGELLRLGKNTPCTPVKATISYSRVERGEQL